MNHQFVASSRQRPQVSRRPNGLARALLFEWAVEPDLLPSDLLHLLHSLVVTDGGPSELTGKLAVGVQGELGTFWWSASFTDEIVTNFPKRAPADADAIFLMGESEALSVLTGEGFSERPKLEIQGDWSLMERFFGRYLSHRRRREAKSGSHPEDQNGLSQRLRRTISSARLRALRGMSP